MRRPDVEISRAALARLLEVAYDGAAAALAFYGDIGRVDLKGDASPVTQADRAAHAAIMDGLSSWDASVPIISEEAPIPPYSERSGWRRFWLVDPLDGTKEFIARNGEFTVNIALIEGGRPVLGAIVAPALETAYFAGSSLGAWRSDARGQPVSLRMDHVVGAPIRVVESRSHPSPRLDAFLASIGPVQRIPLGSSLKFCRVAEGAADIYPRFGRTMEWDVAAGDCIFRSARPADGVVCAAYNQPTLSIPEFVIGERSVCARAAAMEV